MNQKLVLPINNAEITAGYKNKAYRKAWGWIHYGIDIVSATGTRTLYACGNGEVIAAGMDGATPTGKTSRLGNAIVIVYKDALCNDGVVRDLSCRCYHLESLSVKTGDKVTKDTVIGMYGNTGANTSGAHLHIEFDTDIKYPCHAKGISGNGNIVKAGTIDSTINPASVWFVDSNQSIKGRDNSNCWSISDIPKKGKEVFNGIDVSYAQGVIDWKAVKQAGTVGFAIIRAGYGWDDNTQIDKQFRANVLGCQSEGIPFGLYHYSYAKSVEDAAAEARWFLKVIEGLKPEYPICYDFEETFQIGGASKEGFPVAKQMDMIDAWMKIIQGAGCFAALYSTGSAIKRLRDAFPERMGKYAVWVAHINTQNPMTPGGIWQYSWTGHIDGILGDVDLDVAYEDYPAIIKAAGLNGWDKPAPPVAPPKADTVTFTRAEWDALFDTTKSLQKGV